MSSLATAINVIKNPPDDCIDEETKDDQVSPNDSLQSKDSNQMETNSVEELGKHLDDLINEEDNKEKPKKKRYLLAPVTHSSDLHCSQGFLSQLISEHRISSTFFGP